MTTEETVEATATETPVAEAAVETAPSTSAPTTGKLCAADLIRAFEAEQLKSDLPEIYVGDTVKVGTAGEDFTFDVEKAKAEQSA